MGRQRARDVFTYVAAKGGNQEGGEQDGGGMEQKYRCPGRSDEHRVWRRRLWTARYLTVPRSTPGSKADTPFGEHVGGSRRDLIAARECSFASPASDYVDERIVYVNRRLLAVI